MAEKAAVSARVARALASFGSLHLAVPECERGLGAVIGAADSPNRIAGVRIEPFSVYPDDRGYFLEVQRMGQGLASEFPAATTQISAALSFPGTIKAFHFHLHQTDCWTPARECSRWRWWTCGWTPRPSACATPCMWEPCGRGAC